MIGSTAALSIHHQSARDSISLQSWRDPLREDPISVEQLTIKILPDKRHLGEPNKQLQQAALGKREQEGAHTSTLIARPCLQLWVNVGN